MNKTNLIDFCIVGKYYKDKNYKILVLKSSENGWTARCDDASLNTDYISNEKIPNLLDWFKCDFSQYRMFEDLQEALAYRDEKLRVDKNSNH